MKVFLVGLLGVVLVGYAQIPISTVIVRVNDRGPFVKGRIIDLSLTAAQEVDMIEEGVVKVRIEIIT